MGKMICGKCNVELEKRKTTFQYLDSEFYEDLPRCPKCGQVYIDESLVRGRMSEVETMLEDK